MSNIDLIDELRFSTEEKMNLLYNIRDILNQSTSNDQAAAELVQSIEALFQSKIEELKEKIDNKEQGIFSNHKKMSFKRIT